MEPTEKGNIEEKYLHIENIGKNLITTIFGIILMAIAVTAMTVNIFVPELIPKVEWYYLGGIFVLGFILMFMKDNMKTYIDIAVRKKIDNTK